MSRETFLAELRRRRVFRVVLIYLVIAPAMVAFASDAFPALDLPGWALTLVVVLAILGFPLAVGLAWAFDVTPQGIERTSERETPFPSALPTSAPREESDAPALGVATLPPAEAAAPAVPRTPPAAASVAVLPFVDLSPDKDQEYFSDGLTEELLNVLAQVPGLRVPARTSSFAFKGRNTDIREIGDVLGVRTVLEGSVRTSERRVLITAQLIDVEDGYHLWSDTYKRDLRDIFEVQEEIARSIVQTLKGRLLGEAETPQVKEATTDPEAYQLYLKGSHFAMRFSVEDYRKALALFEQALARDPAFARAWASLASSWLALAYLGAEPVPTAIPRARAAADRALELDPELADGYQARARIAIYGRDFAAAERHMRRALELNPTAARTENSYGMLLLNLGRAEEAIARIQRAGELDPLWAGPLNNLGLAYVVLGRREDAVATYQQALDLAPMSGPIAMNIAATLSRLGRHEEAIARMREVHARQPDSHTRSGLADSLLAAGQQEEAEALLTELERLRAEGEIVSLDLAVLYAALGRFDEAFAALEQGLAAEEPSAAQLATDSSFDPLRKDARWEPLLVRAGFPEDTIRRSRELYERRRAAAALPPGRRTEGTPTPSSS